MTRFLLGLLAALTVGGASTAAPLEAYGRLPNIEDVDISSDGSMLAAIVTDGEARTVLVKRIADSKIVSAVKAGDVKVRDVRWAGPNYLLITTTATSGIPGTSAPRGEYAMVQVLDVRNGKLHRLMTGIDRALDVVVDLPMVRFVDGHPIVFLEGYYLPAQKSRVALFKVELDSGFRTSLLEGGFENSIDWTVDGQGRAVAVAEYDRNDSRWSLRVRVGDKWQKVRTLDAPIDVPELRAWDVTGAQSLW